MMDDEWLVLDGAAGEGGGQILRSALALSMITGQPLRLENVRAGRSRPGLQRQHLAAVFAAAKVSKAMLDGAHLGSTELWFQPGRIMHDEFEFDIGSAGSATLVLQTVLPALWLADGGSWVRVIGGTHNEFAPPFEFFSRSFLPLVARLGAHAEATLVRPGYYPEGGGEIELRVEPVEKWERLDLLERGELRRVSATAVVSHLPAHVAQRELHVIGQRLQLKPAFLTAQRRDESEGPGNFVFVAVESEHVTEIATGFGRKGLPAEDVAAYAAADARRYLDTTAAVGQHLADQLLLPLAIGAGGAFVTLEPTSHLRTNINTIQAFLPSVRIDVVQLDESRWLVDVAV
jgi:RNA 3'-terminal phosphate cyclase (ATP)